MIDDNFNWKLSYKQGVHEYNMKGKENNASATLYTYINKIYIHI